MAAGRRPGAPRGCRRGRFRAGLTRLRALPSIGCPASRHSPPRAVWGVVALGREERRGEGERAPCRARRLRSEGLQRGEPRRARTARGCTAPHCPASPRTAPHCPAPPVTAPLGGGGRCRGRWSRGRARSAAAAREVSPADFGKRPRLDARPGQGSARYLCRGREGGRMAMNCPIMRRCQARAG